MPLRRAGTVQTPAFVTAPALQCTARALRCVRGTPVSQRPAAVDDVGDAGGEGALVARKVDCERADLFRGAEPAHRLAADEHFAAARAGRGGAVQHRWRLDG